MRFLVIIIKLPYRNVEGPKRCLLTLANEINFLLKITTNEIT